jgi:hypothetical protein
MDRSIVRGLITACMLDVLFASTLTIRTIVIRTCDPLSSRQWGLEFSKGLPRQTKTPCLGRAILLGGGFERRSDYSVFYGQ